MDVRFLYTSRHWNKAYGGMLEMKDIYEDFAFEVANLYDDFSHEKQKRVVQLLKHIEAVVKLHDNLEKQQLKSDFESECG